MAELSDISILSDLEPDERLRLLEALRSEPDCARLVARWSKFEAALAARWDVGFPDISELVEIAVSGVDKGSRSAVAERGIDVGLSAVPDLIAAIETDAALYGRLWDEQSRTKDRAPVRNTRGGARRARRFAYAAVTAAIVVSAVIGYAVTRNTTLPLHRVDGPERGIAMVRLEDQSVVRLLADSRIEYRIGEDERYVRLFGSALFDVPRSGALFVVESHNARIEVLGTTFAVRLDGDQTEAVVAAGAVVLRAKNGSGVVQVGEGQRSVVVGDAVPSEPAFVDIADALEWTGLIVFRSAPLGSIAESLQSIYGTGISVSQGLSEVIVTGTFDSSQTLPQILSIIADAVEAAVVGDTESGFRLVPR